MGMKSRGVYETPGGTVLLEAHRAIESITLDRGEAHLKVGAANIGALLTPQQHAASLVLLLPACRRAAMTSGWKWHGGALSATVALAHADNVPQPKDQRFRLATLQSSAGHSSSRAHARVQESGVQPAVVHHAWSDCELKASGAD